MALAPTREGRPPAWFGTRDGGPEGGIIVEAKASDAPNLVEAGRDSGERYRADTIVIIELAQDNKQVNYP